jgi:hypothetical protein
MALKLGAAPRSVRGEKLNFNPLRVVHARSESISKHIGDPRQTQHRRAYWLRTHARRLGPAAVKNRANSPAIERAWEGCGNCLRLS